MSFDKNERNKLETDDMNIKSCLNDVLEEEGISVTEDLINRTLNAIKQASEDPGADKTEDNNKKHVSMLRKTRFYFSAAAVIVLLIGINAAILLSGRKKSELNMTARDPATSESAEEFNTAEYSEEAGAEISENSINEGEDVNATEYKMFSENAPEDSGTNDMSFDSRQENDMKISSIQANNEISFSDMACVEPDDVKSVTVTGLSSGKTVTLNERDKIEQFFSTMESYTFIQATGGQAEEQFVIVISAENEEIRIAVGSDYVEKETTEGEIVSHSVYSVSDYGSLSEDLNEILLQYNN